MKDSDYADHLIDVYLSGITSISNDAGWDGDSMMARLIEFHGDIPVGTGNDQSNLSMILAVDKLRGEHALFDDLKRVIGKMLQTYGENDKILALLARRYYQGINSSTGKAFTSWDRLCRIGHAPSPTRDMEQMGARVKEAEENYRKRVRAAREMLLERVKRSEKCVAA